MLADALNIDLQYRQHLDLSMDNRAGDKELMVFIDSMYRVAYIRKSRQQYQFNLGFGWSEEQSKASGMIFNFFFSVPLKFHYLISHLCRVARHLWPL